MKSQGIVYLVGAGPGNYGLMTLRGAELLAKAEVVVYDALINPDFLKLAPVDAEKIYAGKRSNHHAIPQEELNELLVKKAREGKRVVRLKGGDPYVFGRGGEEAEVIAKAKIRFEIVPGISSSVAGPNFCGIPVTHRDYCSSYTVITGHEDPTRDEGRIDWAEMARMPGTKVVLMGVEQIGSIAGTLVKNGMKAETPVAMVRWATTGRQQTIEGTLSTIERIVKEKNFSAPAVAVIGDVVKLRSKLNWFESRQLFNQRIVVTRTRVQASELVQNLREEGADVLEIPTIRIEKPTNPHVLAEALIGLNSYDWIIFTSPNGVTSFFDYFFKAFDDIRDIGGVRIAAVGPATAAKIAEYHLKVDLMPEEYVTSQIAKAFAGYESIENLRLLLMRAEVANEELPSELEKMGAIVDDVPCYRTVTETEDTDGVGARLLEEGADWVTFTSSSTVENFHARFNLPELAAKFPKMNFASIGPETSKAIEKLGLTPHLEAKKHTIAGLTEALITAIRKSRNLKS